MSRLRIAEVPRFRTIEGRRVLEGTDWHVRDATGFSHCIASDRATAERWAAQNQEHLGSTREVA